MEVGRKGELPFCVRLSHILKPGRRTLDPDCWGEARTDGRVDCTNVLKSFWILVLVPSTMVSKVPELTCGASWILDQV